MPVALIQVLSSYERHFFFHHTLTTKMIFVDRLKLLKGTAIETLK